MKRQLEALGASADQVSVNPCGVDITQFRPGQPISGLVISVGRFVDKKAPELGLLAFSKVLQRVPNARLLMLGDGPLRPAVERLVAALHLENNVRLEGGLDHPEVVEAMGRASVFMQHSVVDARGDREGTPVAVLEAGAAGTPVVATRHEGIAEVVVDGETGILVDEHDTDAMGSAIAELLSDPQHARELGRAARRRVEGEYSMDVSIERLSSVLESALSGNGGASRPL
jgi:glycosyltransferase involved in cell wall biosynthesis